jgi:phosphatidate cytidylyltransferase
MAVGLLAGGSVLALLLLFASVVGMMELYRIYGIHKELPGIAGYILAAVYYGLICTGMERLPELFLVAALMIFMGIYVFTFPKYHTNQIMCAYFALIYVTVMLSYICKIRMHENGIYLVWLVFICSWINDTCAYLVGITIGKHKMTPKLSPKKSVEGAIGGIVGSGIIGFLYALFLQDRLIIENSLVAIPAACCIGAALSIIGDLAASAIKRNHDVKDYGRLIPGHGGILDRFDSVIFTAPVVYWVIWIFENLPK